MAGAVLELLSALALGSLLLRPIARKFSPLEFWIFAYLAGSALLSLLVFVLAVFHLATKPVFLGLGLVTLPLLLWKQRPMAGRFTMEPWHWRVFLALFAGFGLLYLCNALAPEFSPDGATYHLGNVVRWVTDRGFTKYTGSLYANWSQGIEMLFLFVFPFGGHPAAALVHLSFLLLLPWIFLAFGQRFGRPWPMVIAGLLVYLSPVVGRAGSSAYNDVALACVLFGSVYCLMLCESLRDWRFAALAGLLAGFGFSIKYTAVFGIAYGLGYLGWKRGWRQLAVFAATALISVAPWLIKNWIWLGNPVSPFFNTLFPNPYIHVAFERDYVQTMALYAEIPGRWLLPFYYAYKGTYVGGIFGPWILLLPLALLGIRDQMGRRLLIAGTVVGLGTLANCGTRFLLPLVMFWAPALCLRFPRASVALLCVHAVLSFPAVIPLYSGPSTWRIEGFPWVENESQFLASKIAAYPMARFIDENTPKDAKIFTLSQVPAAYTSRRLWHEWESAEGELAHEALLTASKPWFWELGYSFAPVRVSKLRIIANVDCDDPMQISEVTGIGATARPNPWDARLVLDGNEFTAWSTWQPTRSGMYLEIDSGNVVIEQVRLVVPGGQWKASWRLEGLVEGLGWRTLRDDFQRKEHPKPVGSAVTALQAMGFTHLVAAQPMQLPLIGQAGGLSLFQIK